MNGSRSRKWECLDDDYHNYSNKMAIIGIVKITTEGSYGVL